MYILCRHNIIRLLVLHAFFSPVAKYFEELNTEVCSQNLPNDSRSSVQVAHPLIRWFKTKSQLCRELETEAIREYLAAQEGNGEEEKTAASRSTVEEKDEEARDATVGNRTLLSGKENARDAAEGDSPRAIRIVKARANAKAAVAAGVAASKSRRTVGFESED